MKNHLVQKNHSQSLLARINGALHERTLSLFMVIVLGHWLEHLVQIYQVYILGWAPKAAGGVLGLWFPSLAASEVLHFTYNSLIFAGILLLLPGFVGRSRRWWWVTVAAGAWHFFEHLILQVQWLTGYYLFGASTPMGIGQLWIPRVELHFLYNLIVFVPMVVGMIYHFYPPRHDKEEARCTCAHRENSTPPGDMVTTAA
jgi:hypothetical protein